MNNSIQKEEEIKPTEFDYYALEDSLCIQVQKSNGLVARARKGDEGAKVELSRILYAFVAPVANCFAKDPDTAKFGNYDTYYRLGVQGLTRGLNEQLATSYDDTVLVKLIGRYIENEMIFYFQEKRRDSAVEPENNQVDELAK